MKHNASNFPYERERNDDLMRAYLHQIRMVETIRIPEIFERIVDMPSRRFWVSEERATVVVAAMLKGHSLHGMRPTKRRMYEEIHRRVVALRALHPGRSLTDLVTEVTSQPAPCFYLTPASAKVIFYRIKKKWHLNRC